jgi:hypothetical protein
MRKKLLRVLQLLIGSYLLGFALIPPLALGVLGTNPKLLDFAMSINNSLYAPLADVPIIANGYKMWVKTLCTKIDTCETFESKKCK